MADLDILNTKMRFETPFDNYAVSNWDGREKEIQEELLQIEIKKNDYDPQLQALEGAVDVRIDWTELEDDEENGEDVEIGMVVFDEDEDEAVAAGSVDAGDLKGEE
jgi:hypothetical protein